jgi:hypothetical protein
MSLHFTITGEAGRLFTYFVDHFSFLVSELPTHILCLVFYVVICPAVVLGFLINSGNQSLVTSAANTFK